MHDMIPTVRAYVRPDGRRFVWDPDPESLAEVTTDVYCTVEAAKSELYVGLGFTVHRREATYMVPIRSVRAEAPHGISFANADEVEETALRLLDNELRQDVPGSDGWQWTEADFREETYEAPDFDPETYLVALDVETAEYVGIVRVWMKRPTPRLGFIGVRVGYRRRGIARALLAEVFTRLDERGLEEVSTEIDETNTASRALLEGLGARRTGTTLELIRREIVPS